MKQLCQLLVLTGLLLTQISPALSQSKMGIGFNVGGQRLYGDFTDVQIGPGLEGTVAYQFLPFAEVMFALGYGQLKFLSLATNDVFNIDLKSNLEIISEGNLRPYVTAGLGLLNSEAPGGRNFDGSFFGGAGFKVRAHPDFNVYLGADYRFITSDMLDGVATGKSKDGYLNVRAGLNYYIGGSDNQSPQIIAGEAVPFYEVEEEPDYFARNQPNTGAQMPETQDMEEYVKLKSRIDELSGTIDSREREISELQKQLYERKSNIDSMEEMVSSQPRKAIKTNSSASSFAEAYENALTHYYNKNYPEAISVFKTLLQQHPNHPLASNCQYWVGRSLLASNRFNEAIDEFFKVLRFERSLKKDDALFYMARAYMNLGSGAEAKRVFSQLLNDYPDSEFTGEARDYMSRL